MDNPGKKMSRSAIIRPTNAELEILHVLWHEGTCTVHAVQAVLNQRRPTGYTTVLKLLQIMLSKGLVVRDESQRAHRYSARFAASEMQQHLVGDLLDRAFGGSASKLVMQALSSRKASQEELAEIRLLLDQLEDASDD